MFGYAATYFGDADAWVILTSIEPTLTIAFGWQTTHSIEMMRRIGWKWPRLG